METPPPPSSTRSNMARITKQMLLSIITHFPFEALVVPSRFATNREEDIPGFIGALMDALKTTLLENAPAHSSPRKLIAPLAYEPATPTPIWPSMSTVVTAEEDDEDISLEPTPFMLRLRGAQKKGMKMDAAERKVKVERDALEEEAHIGAEELTSQKVDEGEQMGNITEGEMLVRTDQDVLKPQQNPFFTSNQSIVTDVPSGREENVDSIDSGSIYQPSTQDPTLSKS